MSFQRILIHYGGHWESSNYVGGDGVIVHFSTSELSCDLVIREVRQQMGYYSDYSLYYLTSTNDIQKKKVALKTDMDLYRMIIEQKDAATIYVISMDKNTDGVIPTTQQSTVYPEVNVGEPSSTALPRDESEDDLVESSDEEAHEVNRLSNLFESLTTEFGAWIREPGRIDKIIGDHSLPSKRQETDAENFGTDDAVVRNWLLPHVDENSVLTLGWIEPSGPSDGQLRKSAIFKPKRDLTLAVGMYHLENRLEYAVERSCSERLNFICKHKGCTFMSRARQKGRIWQVKKYQPEHTCIFVLDRTAPRQVPAKVLGSFFARRLITHGAVLKPNEKLAEVLREYGIEIDYGFALRARNIAIEMIYGDFEKSYQDLPSYLYLLSARNPESVYDIVTFHSTNRLSYLFLALGQSVQVFQQDLLRPVIVVDGTHLKGKNKGTLFVAVTKDRNEQVFPLAIGLGPIEDDDSWIWFLSKLKGCFGAPPNLLIVSDQQISIRNAVVYPEAAHGLCYYHITKNLATYKEHALAIFQETAYAYRDLHFDDAFDALKSLRGDGAYRRLIEIGVSRWARSKCPVPRTSFMTSNAAEIMNSRLLWVRRLPVCTMLEVYRTIVEKWFDEHRANAISRQHEITEKTFLKLSKAVEWGRHYTTRRTTLEHLFKVEGDTNTSYIVDLQHSTCECCEFELDMMPCRHACAVIRFVKGNVYDYVSHYFKQSTLVATYSAVIKPVPHPGSGNLPSWITESVVRPPLIEKQAGRPKLSRTRSALEGKKQRCTRCLRDGHNRRVCTASLPVGGVDLNMPPESEEAHEDVNHRRARKKCSVCKNEGHTRPRCPLRSSE